MITDADTDVVATDAGSPSLDVLLPAYQGARYLPEQLDSILAQSRSGLRILVRDDGSSDATPAVLADYAARHPEIVAIDDRRPRLGAAAPASSPCWNGPMPITYSSAIRTTCGSPAG